jgi:PleD family two-component response regulator
MQLAAALRIRAKSMVVRDRRKPNVEVTVPVSLGVTALLNGDDASQFVARADAALYKSEQGGRDRVTFN